MHRHSKKKGHKMGKQWHSPVKHIFRLGLELFVRRLRLVEEAQGSFDPERNVTDEIFKV
jgi:hypothetical protein